MPPNWLTPITAGISTYPAQLSNHGAWINGVFASAPAWHTN
jgi:hypothetical protein